MYLLIIYKTHIIKILILTFNFELIQTYWKWPDTMSHTYLDLRTINIHYIEIDISKMVQ